MAGNKPYEFTSHLLGQALFDRHHAFRGLTELLPPIRFGFMPNNDPDLARHGRGSGRSLSVLIEDGNGFWQWCIFSYYDVASPVYEYTKKLFTTKCRNRWYGKWRELKKTSVMCMSCGVRRAVDVDHIFPSHSQIRDVCWRVLNEKYPHLKEQWWKSQQDPFRSNIGWDDKHPLTVLYDSLTVRGTYQDLCKPCHHRITADRRRSPWLHESREIASLPLEQSVRFLADHCGRS